MQKMVFTDKPFKQLNTCDSSIVSFHFSFFSFDDTFQAQDTEKEGESYKVGLTLGKTWTLSEF